MFSRNKKSGAADAANTPSQSKRAIPSVISSGTHILGNIVSELTVDIDGTVEGNVRAEQATVRENGKITGDIVANSVHIYGEVRGLIRAHAVHLYSSAHVTGVIVHQSLTVEDGAFIDAKFKRMHDVSDYTPETSDSESDDDGLIESAPAFGTGTLRLIG
ncbi:MAG TPA: polymer-forming cytoskeletal protein [Rickettsiales bacterium]|nr:polymer-forming cytoskeletal protein [Rickettsiales bacterium]